MCTSTHDLDVSVYWHGSVSQTDFVKPEHQKEGNIKENSTNVIHQPLKK